LIGPGSAAPVDAVLALHGARIEEALTRALDRVAGRVAKQVAAAMRHGTGSGGKRLRPILCVAAHDACGGPTGAPIYDLGASLEMIHAYSLMHDDLPCMDDAALRRGRPATHVEHGEEVTMRAGAALIPLAAAQAWQACVALGCGDTRARRVTRTLLEGAGAGGMVGGQWLDLLGEERPLDPPALDDLHRRKTGALLLASLLMGARAAGADEPVEAALTTYGEAVGLAFQIADDILDATASAAELGKNPSDHALAKSTYVSRHGVEEAGRRAESEIERALAALAGAGLAGHPLGALARFVIARRS
jgi:geranylgeranyl pyrophosphate synthase